MRETSPLAANTGRGGVTFWETLELSVLLKEAGRRGKLYLQSLTHLEEGQQPSPAPTSLPQGRKEISTSSSLKDRTWPLPHTLPPHP